jgi:5-methylcytosine-specific restriction protein A
MGGMRRSHQTNTLVIVSDHTKGLYDDKWYGNVLHYTGMGKNGDQDINFMQNKTLAEYNSNSVNVHLFEVFKAAEYTYMGEVFLVGPPYQETQKGEDGSPRNVWMFPLRRKQEDYLIEEEKIEGLDKAKLKISRRLALDKLKQRAEDNQSVNVSIRETKAITYIRDPYVSEYAKRIADGKCQLCGGNAPFTDNEGKPYLETHHIEWLSNGGADTINNTVALCPNCHRRMHVLSRDEDVEKLKGRLDE